jgi:hypothetical protein
MAVIDNIKQIVISNPRQIKSPVIRYLIVASFDPATLQRAYKVT